MAERKIRVQPSVVSAMGQALRSANVRMGAPPEAERHGENLRKIGWATGQVAKNRLMEAQSAFTLPGDVWAGRVDPGSEEGLDRASLLAGTVFSGAAPNMLMSGPSATAVGMFAGPRARSADLSKLGLANLLEKRGAAPEEIWNQTGWFRGADKKWRFEISDEGAHISHRARDLLEEGKSFKAGELGGFRHPEMYRAYPELNRTDIHPYPAEGNRGTSFGGNIGLKRDLFPPDMRSTLLHEFQHEIQDIEGWHKGGQSSMFRLTPERQQELLDHHGRLDEIAYLQELLYTGWTPEKIEKAVLRGRPPTNLRIAESTSPQLIQLEREMIERQLRWGELEGYAGYHALAGEVEARNVQARERLTEPVRRNSPPFLSEDVTRPEQIVIDQQGRFVGMGYELVPVEGNPFQGAGQ